MCLGADTRSKRGGGTEKAKPVESKESLAKRWDRREVEKTNTAHLSPGGSVRAGARTREPEFKKVGGRGNEKKSDKQGKQGVRLKK